MSLHSRARGRVEQVSRQDADEGGGQADSHGCAGTFLDNLGGISLSLYRIVVSNSRPFLQDGVGMAYIKEGLDARRVLGRLEEDNVSMRLWFSG